MATAALPLFHLYGDPPDDQAFDFIHIETIASRSSIHDWTIRAHRHRNLFQILLIGSGGGEMTFEAASIAFEAPCAILVPATIAHGFRFQPRLTDGWVMTFTEDVAEAMGDRRGEALARLKALAAEPVVPLGDAERDRIGKLAVELHEERFLARAGFRIAMRGLLALIAVEVARLAAARGRAGEGPVALEPTGATVDALRKLVEEARKANGDRDRHRIARDAAYHFMSAMAGNLPHFEEASRALFADDRRRFTSLIAAWPDDIRDHIVGLAFSDRGDPVDPANVNR